MLSATLPTYYTIVARLLTEIDLLLNNYVFNGYQAVSGYLRVPLGLVTLIYIVLQGYGLLTGQRQLKMGDAMRSVLKIGFIYMAVTEWGWVSSNFIALVNDTVNGLGSALISASPIHIPGVGGINGALQLVLIQFSKVGSTLFQTGGLMNFGGWLDGIVVWGFGYLVVGLALLEIILSKVLLAVLFVFTPLMAVLCYFKPLQSSFDRWLGGIIGAAFLQLFVMATLALSLSICYWWVASFMTASALQIGNYGTLPVIIIGIVCIGMIFKAAQLAQNLGGMVTTVSGSSMAAGLIGGMVGGAVARAGSAAKTLRKGVASGAGRFAHGSAMTRHHTQASQSTHSQSDNNTGDS